MSKARGTTLLSLIIFVMINETIASSFGATTINVVDLGATSDGETDNAESFKRAWDLACGSRYPATIYVPKGTFNVRQARFNGPCRNRNVAFDIQGMLVAPSDYNVNGNADSWLAFESVDGITVRGGFLDGRGNGVWACKNHSGQKCPLGATNLSFTNSKNINVTGLTSQDSQMFHLVINGCNNVTLQDITVKAPGNSPNTDGIHVQLSTNVTITHSQISTGDDCISIGPGTRNLWMENIFCGPGHGVSIGSLAKDLEEKGVENVTLKTASFIGTQNGVRIKSWGKPSNGFVKNALFNNLTMTDVQNPILIDQNYCPGNVNCPHQESGVKISDVTYQSIHGTSATEVAVKFDCSKARPCVGIRLRDVKLSFEEKQARASCSYAVGKVFGQIEPTSCL